jgi:methylenetetrahydrofolate reductase (NADPH)
MAPIAGCCLASAAGIEPVMAMSCRDRGLRAIQSDAMAAHALGVRNLIVISGDAPRRRSGGDRRAGQPVESPEALRVLDRLRRLGGPAGRRERPLPLLLGATADPAQPPERHFARLSRKVRNGADLLVTQLVTDPQAFAAWMRAYRDALGPLARPVLVGVGLFRSPRTIDSLNRRAIGVRIPQAWRDQLAASADPESYAIAAAVELVGAVRQIPAVHGAYLVALGWYAGLQRLMNALAAAGLASVEP